MASPFDPNRVILTGVPFGTGALAFSESWTERA